MKRYQLRILAGFLFFSGFLFLGSWMHKTIQIVIDGEARSLTTFSLRVQDALHAAHISVGSGDRLTPALDDWLKDGDTISLDRAALVQILADGQTISLTSSERLPANLLTQAGVRLYPSDRLLVDGAPTDPATPLLPAPTHSLQILRAYPVTLTDGKKVYTFPSSQPTLGQALAAQGISLYTADRLDPSPETRLEGPVDARLHRSRALTISHGQTQTLFRSAAGSVGETLAEAGLSLQGLDYSLPAASDPLPADGQVRVVRVQESVVLEQEPLPFESELQPTADLELDTRKEIQPGEYGITARRLRIRYEDGQEVSRTVEDEWVALQPKPRLLGYGTQVVIKSLDTGSGTIQYWRAVQMYATSYSPCRIFKDRCDSYTASGATLAKGIAAMTGAWYRYYGGTQVYVPGYGVATIADTGGGISGRYWIDLGYSESDYVSWHQWVTVYFLTPVPDVVPWLLP